MNELDSALIALGEQCKDLLKSVESVRLMLAGLRTEEPDAPVMQAPAAVKKQHKAAKQPAKENPPAAKKEQITIEQVRAVMAEKRKAGYEAETKALLINRGKTKLSEVDSGEYEALLAEAERIGE